MPRWRDGRRVQVLPDDSDVLVADERRSPADQLVEHRAERVEVAPRGDFAARRLLRRHVRDGADHHPRLSEAAPVDRNGEPEVADLRDASLS